MKIYIQKQHTGEFLNEQSEWTPNEREARDFQSSLNAVFFCQTNKINNVNIVMRFKNPRNDVRLPIGEFSA